MTQKALEYNFAVSLATLLINFNSFRLHIPPPLFSMPPPSMDPVNTRSPTSTEPSAQQSPELADPGETSDCSAGDGGITVLFCTLSLNY